MKILQSKFLLLLVQVLFFPSTIEYDMKCALTKYTEPSLDSLDPICFKSSVYTLCLHSHLQGNIPSPAASE